MDCLKLKSGLGLSAVLLLCGMPMNGGVYAQAYNYGTTSPTATYNPGASSSTVTMPQAVLLTPEQLAAQKAVSDKQLADQRLAVQQQQAVQVQQRALQTQQLESQQAANRMAQQQAEFQAQQQFATMKTQAGTLATNAVSQGITAGSTLINQGMTSLSTTLNNKVASLSTNNAENCRLASFFLVDPGSAAVANLLNNGSSSYAAKYSFILNAFKCKVPQFCNEACEGNNKAQMLWEAANKPVFRTSKMADYQVKRAARLGRYCAVPPIEDQLRPVSCFHLCTATTAPNCYAKGQAAGTLDQYSMSMNAVISLRAKIMVNPKDTVSIKALSDMLMPTTYQNADLASQNVAEVANAANFLFPPVAPLVTTPVTSVPQASTGQAAAVGG